MHSPASGPQPGRTDIDAGRLWAGGAATALVAALVALVGVLIGEGLLDLSMAEPPLLPLGESFAGRYAVTAAALALVATALAHLLVVSTPRPAAFFRWVVGLVTAAGVAIPLATDGSLGGRLATAAVDLVLGLCVMSLLSSVLARTTRPRTLRVTPPPGRG